MLTKLQTSKAILSSDGMQQSLIVVMTSQWIFINETNDHLFKSNNQMIYNSIRVKGAIFCIEYFEYLKHISWLYLQTWVK